MTIFNEISFQRGFTPRKRRGKKLLMTKIGEKINPWVGFGADFNFK
jgi:hypothetical protein